MSGNFRPYSVDQYFLLPPDIREWVPEGHISRFLSDTVETLDLSDFRSSYHQKTGAGAPAHDPRLMLKILLFGYCVGVRSSRKLERACVESVAMRFLCAGQFPDHDTIASFRKRHLTAFDALFVQVLKLCQKAGLVKLGCVMVDGTKVKASANKSKSRTYERLQQTVRQILKEAEQEDRREDALYGKGNRGDELPEEFRDEEKRLKTIKKLIGEIEAEAQDHKKDVEQERKRMKNDDQRFEQETGKKVPPRYPQMPGTGRVPEITEARRNPTDYDSRIMKEQSSGGFIQGYNCQAAVDSSSQVIVAYEVVNQVNDKGLAPRIIEQVRRNLDQLPRRAVADRDYFSERDIVELERRGVDCYIPPTKPAKGKREKKAGLTYTTVMAGKLQAPIGKMFYRLRKMVIEPVFGQIKERQAFRQFLLRRLEAVQAEWALITTCHNLHKLHKA